MTDDDILTEEFMWALKDPTEEKMKHLVDILLTVTNKLVEWFDKAEKRMDTIDIEMSNLYDIFTDIKNMKHTSTETSDVSTDASVSDIVIEKKQERPKPSNSGGGMTMMGELKQLLEARKKKAESGE